MDKAQFWQLIESSRNKKNDCDKQANKLKKELLKLSAEEIVEFDRIFVGLSDESYRWDLWAAAYIINGGASDDGFQYFRWWLISQGQTYFEAAMKDVERAGDGVEAGEEVECEAIAYCINHAYIEKTGTDLPPHPTKPGESLEPQGQPWEEEELDTLFPALTAKFG